jgi:origin recognition complex subunit 1
VYSLLLLLQQGKTATVHAAIAALRKEQEQEQENTAAKAPSPTFEFIEINCLRISSPQEAYTVLWRGLSGEFIGPQIAMGRLKSYFEDVAARTSAPSDARKSQTIDKPTKYIVCLLDELDYLVTKNESIVYNFFDWPQQQNSGLIVVGIANTMDLPERLNKRSLSRLGGQQLMRIAFKAYTHEQINDILADRLQHLEGVFDSRSLQLTAVCMCFSCLQCMFCSFSAV